MCSSFTSDSSYSADIEELLQIGTMCRELRKEKDMLRESLLQEQSKNAELIKGLESDVKALSGARSEDKIYIEGLERELRNCSQEIGYLQDQLNLRNVEANCVGEHVHSLELKLAEVGRLHEKINILTEELMKSESHCLFLKRELEHKEVELRNSTLHIEELESVVSSISLESHCEIESMKFDLITLEQRCSEADKFREEVSQEKSRMDALIKELEVQFQEAQQMISFLEKENKELQEKLVTFERNPEMVRHKVGEHLDEWLKNSSRLGFYIPSESNRSFCGDLENETHLSNLLCTCGEVLGPFLSKLAAVTAWDENLKDEVEKMSQQIRESKLLVKKLKEELREEKSKAKEEAEDLTQEMAELRYQITEMLEQECKRRACVEQASLQRIDELEAQVRKEQRKSFVATKHFQKLAEERSVEIQHLKGALAGSQAISKNLPNVCQRTIVCSCGLCQISENLFDCFNKEKAIYGESSEEDCTGRIFNRAAIAWGTEEPAITETEGSK